MNDRIHELNQAMASVTLLYFRLLDEGGINNDQTVYVDPGRFDPARFLNINLVGDEDIDESLLRQGALMHLLCDLNDLIGEYEGDYLNQPNVKTILSALNSASWAIPIAARELLLLVQKPLNTSDEFKLYQEKLHSLYVQLVVKRYTEMLSR